MHLPGAELTGQRRKLTLGRARADRQATAELAQGAVDVVQTLEQELRARTRRWRPSSNAGSRQNTGTTESAASRAAASAG